MTKVQLNNYFFHTSAVFTEVNKPDTTPNYSSNSDSDYWYGRDKNGVFVIRKSDHWGSDVASCDWYIAGDTKLNSFDDKKGVRYGKAYIKNFIRHKVRRVTISIHNYKVVIIKPEVVIENGVKGLVPITRKQIKESRVEAVKRFIECTAYINREGKILLDRYDRFRIAMLKSFNKLPKDFNLSAVS